MFKFVGILTIVGGAATVAAWGAGYIKGDVNVTATPKAHQAMVDGLIAAKNSLASGLDSLANKVKATETPAKE